MDRSLRPSGHKKPSRARRPKPSLHDPGLASSRTTIPAALCLPVRRWAQSSIRWKAGFLFPLQQILLLIDEGNRIRDP